MVNYEQDILNMGRCFALLNRRSQLFITEACSHLGLSYSEYVILIRLYDNEGCSQEELAAMLSLDKAVVTRTVHMLEKKDMVTREADEKDRRVKRLHLTEKAKKNKNYLQGLIIEWADYLGADVSKEQVDIIRWGFQKAAEKATAADIKKMAAEARRREGIDK